MSSPLHFFKEVYEELLKVTWPTQKEVIRLTFLVVAMSIIVGVFIGGIDFLLVKLTETLIK